MSLALVPTMPLVFYRSIQIILEALTCGMHARWVCRSYRAVGRRNDLAQRQLCRVVAYSRGRLEKLN